MYILIDNDGYITQQLSIDNKKIRDMLHPVCGCISTILRINNNLIEYAAINDGYKVEWKIPKFGNKD